ncbi:MAG: hypothetical protein IJA84_03665 [Clostridia bacterium]|nr:hypothetical protein [Clostridia bacterium]
MRNTTDRNRKKRAAMLCAALFIGFLGIYLAVILFPLLHNVVGDLWAVALLIVYSILVLAAIVCILLALRQRLREIEGGEEDEAKKY